jgi:hypothetical protein
MKPIFEKCPFKENGKLSKLFLLVLRGLNLLAGSDNPQNKILWGIRPRRTRPCGVSDPAELSLAGYQTPQNNGSPAGYQTLRGIKPRGTTFKNEYFCEFKKEFTNILRCESGDYMGSIHRKNQRSKISG